MAFPHELIPRLEGLAGIIAARSPAAVDSQEIITWVEMCKQVMRQEAVRGLSTWEFTRSTDVDESANQIITNACTVYAVLIESNAAAADRVSLTNATSNTYDDTAALDAGDLLVLHANSSGTEATERWTGYVFPSGVTFDTALSVGADGIGGTNPAADDIDLFVLYTDDA